MDQAGDVKFSQDRDAPARVSADGRGLGDRPAPVPAASLSDAKALQLLHRLDVVTGILRGWIWETDSRHRFTYMSDSVQRFAGRPPEWHYGKTRQELGNLNSDNAEHRKFQAQLEAHEMFGPIDLVRYQNGVQMWMRTIGVPQFDASGQFTGYCGLAFDVTQEIEARQGNRRREPRRRVARTATISQLAASIAIPCVVLDISEGGARLDVPREASVPDRFELTVDVDGSQRACVVVWRRDGAIGVKFRND